MQIFTQRLKGFFYTICLGILHCNLISRQVINTYNSFTYIINLKEQLAFPSQPGYFCLGFAPVVDGPDGLLPSDPWTLREQGKFKKLPLLSGITKDDGSLYTVSSKSTC